MTMIQIASKVFNEMVENPLCRDDDRFLISAIWKQEMRDYPNEDTLDAFQDGKLSLPETIRRARQKLQEKFPMLRGNSYRKRQESQEQFLEALDCV